jgi:ATP-dependent protease ClpP protease subunit
MTKEQTQEILIAKRIFPITGKIENGLITDMEKALLQMCLEDQKRKAELIVDSGGGDAAIALSGYDFIKSLPFPVHCTIIGNCHSATLTLIAACERRKATKYSRFLFHAMGYTPVFSLNEDVQEQLRVGFEQSQIILNNCFEVQESAYKISRKELEQMRDVGERYNVRLTAQQALEKGVIHEIVEKFDFFDPAKVV